MDQCYLRAHAHVQPAMCAMPAPKAPCLLLAQPPHPLLALPGRDLPTTSHRMRLG